MTVLPTEILEKIYLYLPFSKVIHLSKYVAKEMLKADTDIMYTAVDKDDIYLVKHILPANNAHNDFLLTRLIIRCFINNSSIVLNYLYSLKPCLFGTSCTSICDSRTHEIDMKTYLPPIDLYAGIAAYKGYTDILEWLFFTRIITFDVLNKEQLYSFPESKTIVFLIDKGYPIDIDQVLLSLVYNEKYDILEYYSKKYKINMVNFASANNLPCLFKRYFLKNKDDCSSDTIDCVASAKMLTYIHKHVYYECTLKGIISAASRNDLILLVKLEYMHPYKFNLDTLCLIKNEATKINSNQIIDWCLQKKKFLKNRK